MTTAPPIAPIGSVRQQIDFNASPKVRFRESGDSISKHRALIESREFERGIDFALMQYSRELADEVVKDSSRAGFCGLKLAGAHEFIKTLRTLSEVQSVKFTAPNDNLGGS